MKNLAQIPLYLKTTVILLLIIIIFTILYFARFILVPLTLAGLLAILLYPLDKWLERRGVPCVLAIFLCILLIFIIAGGLIYLLYTQILVFANDLPHLTQKLANTLEKVTEYIQGFTKISSEEQLQWFNQKMGETLQESGSVVSNALNTTTNMLAIIALQPIYIFFFLFYRRKFKAFLFQISPDAEQHRTEILIQNVKKVVQSYMSGVLIVIIILAVMNSTALYLIGVPYAIFLGVLAALLNIIPYIGVLIGNILATTVALLTGELWQAAAVLIAFVVIQFIENNILTPSITGGKVKINPLATIIVLLIGGQLWGVAGMILFLPLLGIVKVIFDSMESMKPYGYLLGTDDLQKEKLDMSNIRNRYKKLFKKRGRNE